MIWGLLKIVLDLLVLVALGVALYFGLRLTRALEVFRHARGEMAQMVVQLNRHIEQAQAAIDGLRTASAESGDRLQKNLKDARARAEELELMTAAGDSLARRLEGLAERNRRIAQGLDDEDIVLSQREDSHRDRYESADAGFSIRDSEYGYGADDDIGEERSLGSRAERELYEALKDEALQGKSGKSRKNF